jgi:predicted nucleic-acid-binding protein
VHGSGDALKTADQLGIFIFDQDSAGQNVIRHSIRLKAYREAQQLIEYLNLLKSKQNWSQAEVNQFVNRYVDLNTQVNKIDGADAGTSAYTRLSAVGLERLKRATADLLSRDAANR